MLMSLRETASEQPATVRKALERWRALLSRPPSASAGRIEFLCAPEDKGVIAEPVPAKAQLPDWFRRLPAVDKAHLTPTNNGITIKRCMPFFDALSTGWLLPIAATVRLQVRDGGRTVDAGWDFDRELVSYHGAFQVAGNPSEPRPPCKFHNYWTIRTPPGWSCLFLPPLNRPNPVFEIIAGVVDTDSYHSLIHLPFFATAQEGLYVIEKGTPIAQVIPFRRESAALEGVVRVETAADKADKDRILRATSAGDGWYRKESRSPR
jgi:hypothetical protein